MNSNLNNDTTKAALAIAAGLAIGFSVRSFLSAPKKPSQITLTYFDGRGLAEVSRQMLAIKGVEYNDKRYPLHIAEGDGPIMSRLSRPEMDADNAKGLFDTNLGRLPILDVDGHKFGTSKAIMRYIAQTYGLAGSTPEESATIDSICELCNDIGEAFKGCEDNDKWFDGTGTQMGDRQLQWWLTKLNTLVGSNGFAVGDKFSAADAVIYQRFGERCMTKGIFGSPDSQPFNDATRTQMRLDKLAPNVSKIVSTWRNHPRMEAYLKKRGFQNF